MMICPVCKTEMQKYLSGCREDIKVIHRKEKYICNECGYFEVKAFTDHTANTIYGSKKFEVYQ